MEQSSDEQKPPADAGTEKQSKTYTEDYVKELIAERDKAKEKARKYDEEKKKIEEAKAIEDGRLKELLQQKESENLSLKERAEKYELSQNKLREQALARITDSELKKVAEKLPSVEDVISFAETISKQKLSVHNTKDATVPPMETKFTNIAEWQKYLESIGRA